MSQPTHPQQVFYWPNGMTAILVVWHQGLYWLWVIDHDRWRDEAWTVADAAASQASDTFGACRALVAHQAIGKFSHPLAPGHPQPRQTPAPVLARFPLADKRAREILTAIERHQTASEAPEVGR